MPVPLNGTCLCGAVSFTVQSHTPHPYMRCYCSICRKLSGGGFAINIMGVAASLTITGAPTVARINAVIDGRQSPMERAFCRRCSTALWGWHPTYPDLVHPFASAIDSDLPVPPARTHIMLDFKAPWVEPDIRDGDLTFARYPDQSIEVWHRSRGLWVD